MARTSRAAETRNATSRKAEKRIVAKPGNEGRLYVPPEIIPADKVYRWIRISTRNEPDHDNWSARVEGGWSPVPRDRHPDRFPSMPIPGMGNPEQSNVILRGNGLILCEKDKRAYLAERKALREENNAIIQGIRWTGQDTQAFAGVPTTDEGNIGIERVTAERAEAEFKE